MNNIKTKKSWLKITLTIVGLLVLIFIGFGIFVYIEGPKPGKAMTEIYQKCIVSVKKQIKEREGLEHLRKLAELGDKIKPKSDTEIGGSEYIINHVAEIKCKEFFVKDCSAIFDEVKCKNTLSVIVKNIKENKEID